MNNKQENLNKFLLCEKNNSRLELCKEAIQEWRDGKISDRLTICIFNQILTEQNFTEEEMVYHRLRAKDLEEQARKCLSQK